MRRWAAPLLLGLAVTGGAYALAQSDDIFDPEVIAARERQQLLTAKQQSADAMARSNTLEAQATAARTGPAA